MAGRSPDSSGRPVNGAAEHFGRQLRKAREMRGWTLLDLGRCSGIDAAHLGRIESGKRPPTENVARACDHVFPERSGWFLEWYQDSRDWMPPGFRVWAEHEDTAQRLSVWCPGLIDGLAQTEEYARATLHWEPAATAEQIEIRLASRMERQKRVLGHGAQAVFLVDQPALYRLVGSPAAMARQLRHLLDLGQQPRVTVQVLPQVGHPATGSELIIADDAAYVEHLAGGAVHTDSDAFTRLDTIMGQMRAEAMRASESQALIREATEHWDSQ